MGRVMLFLVVDIMVVPTVPWSFLPEDRRERR
jgi:NADH:ubiquinone oxidoreductase subunit 3 (subunit A)